MGLTKKASGKSWYYIFSYIDSSGKQKKKWINTNIPCSRESQRAKNEAIAIGLKKKKQFLEELKYERDRLMIRHRSVSGHGSDRIVDYSNYWLSEMKGSVEDSTLNAYEAPLKKHILPRIGEIKISELNQFDLKEFINSELEECDRRQRKIDERIKKEGEDKVKVKSEDRPFYQSIKKHLRIISAMMSYAVSEGDAKENPVAKINQQVLKKIPQNDFESHPYNKDEIVRLREVIRGDHLEPVVILSAYLGLRREEALGLRWKDIDFDNQRVNIRNVCRMVGSKIEYVEKTKTKLSRASIPMISLLANYLIDLKEQQARDKELFGDSYVDSELVCRWRDGRPIKPGNVTQGYRRLLEKAGLRITRFHDLRHTVGTIILEETGDLKAASMALRHSDIGITANTYVNPGEDYSRKGFEALDKSLKSTEKQ